MVICFLDAQTGSAEIIPRLPAVYADQISKKGVVKISKKAFKTTTEQRNPLCKAKGFFIRAKSLQKRDQAFGSEQRHCAPHRVKISIAKRVDRFYFQTSLLGRIPPTRNCR